MTTIAAPSLSQIKALVAAIRQKVPHANVIGIHSLARWSEVCNHDTDFAIFQCDSPLSLRTALRKPTEATKVLLTSVSDDELDDDIRLRLAKRRLFQIDAWQIVRSQFDANAVDPRLTRHPWIADLLLALSPSKGFPPAPGGFLDAELVWPLVLEQAFDLIAEPLDITSLLKWSLSAEATQRFRRSPEELRQAAIDWIAHTAGPVAELILHCIERLDRPDAVPIGLAAGVVFHPSASGKLERSAGKLEERYFGSETVAAEQLQRWSAAAVEVVQSLCSTDMMTCRQVTQRLDELLTEIHAGGMAYLSQVSPLGFDERLAHVGRCLSRVLESDSSTAPTAESELVAAVGLAREHDRARNEVRRMERLAMAMRLVRWLRQFKLESQSEPKSFADAAHDYLREGGYADWARLSLRDGDRASELSESYACLFERATEIRQQQSRTFAQLLASWTAAGSQGNDVIPVERILDEVVAPLADDCLARIIHEVRNKSASACV